MINTSVKNAQVAEFQEIDRSVIDRCRAIAAQWSLTNPSDISDETNVKQCFEHFLDNNDMAPLKHYLSSIPSPSYKSPVGVAAALQTSKLIGVPFCVISHEELVDPSAHADDQLLGQNREQLPSIILEHGIPVVVKTITLSVHDSASYSRLVITALGDITIGGETLHAISEATGITYKLLKHHSHINGQIFRPIEQLGQEPGNIGPFPHVIRDIDYFIYRCPTPSDFVAVRFTPFDTICLAREIFETVSAAYLEMFEHKYICI